MLTASFQRSLLHRFLALERIFKFTICSPSSQGENARLKQLFGRTNGVFDRESLLMVTPSAMSYYLEGYNSNGPRPSPIPGPRRPTFDAVG